MKNTRLKRIGVLLLTAVFLIGMTMPAFATSLGTVVTIGADCDSSQKAQVYKDFGIEQGSVEEITVTTDEVREYLEDLLPAGSIGSRSYSSSYIKTLDEGKGLNITLKNISWCTVDMYRNALQTAGILDAEVIITAPHSVTGTTALTGIYKAYETITGSKLDEEAKETAMQEMIVTGEIVEDLIGEVDSEDIAALVNELKALIDQLKDMTDDEVRAEILTIAANLNISLTDEHVEKLLALVRSLEKLDLGELQERLTSFVDNVKNNDGFFSKLWSSVSSFFGKIGEFFSKLFK